MRLPLNLELFQSGDRLLVGISGGVDSLALLHGLAGERDARGLELVAVHVHHGMRGESAEADVEFLAARCEDWRVPLVVERVDVPSLAVQRRISVEEAGREARYSTFNRLAGELGCGKVVTAHHADDQAETLLLHLFRGAGLDGLAAMPERRPLSSEAGAPELVRPLLSVRRRELEAYCRAHQLEPRLDITNLDLQYRRNRIRHELIPTLSGYDPAIVEHLLRLSQQARDERELLSAEAARLLRSAVSTCPPPEFGIPLPALPPDLTLELALLRAAPPALLRRMLRLALRQAAGFEIEESAALIERLLQLMNVATGAIDLPGCSLRAVVSGERLRIESHSRPLPPPAPTEIQLPGTILVPQFGLKLDAVEGPIPVNVWFPPFRAILDVDSLRPTFQLRAPRSGDRFRPLNAPGTRLVSDLFGDRKVPAYYRARWPILTDREGILWVLGLAIAHRARIRPDSSRALYLTVNAAEGSTDTVK